MTCCCVSQRSDGRAGREVEPDGGVSGAGEGGGQQHQQQTGRPAGRRPEAAAHRPRPAGPGGVHQEL